MWNRLSTALARLDRQSARFGGLALVALALAYYGSFVRHDLNLGGEGGTAGVLALRLLEGERPIVDTFLGYNVLWFYPIAWLFQLTGPNYLALRWYFFAICTLSGVFAFLIVRRVSGTGLGACGVGALAILIPGMAFRNYMALLPLLNGWVFLHAFVFEKEPLRARLGWMAAAGASLALTYLVRVDLGAFFSVIFGGLLVLFPFGVRGEIVRRSATAAAGGLLAVVAWAAVHAPFYLDARRRGYDAAFVGQYTEIWDMLRYQAGKEILDKLQPRRPRRSTRPSRPSRVPASIAESRADAPMLRIRGTPYRAWKREWSRARLQPTAPDDPGRRVLQRRPLDELWQARTFYEAAFVAALYAPLAISLVILVTASGVLVASLLTRNSSGKESSLVALVTLGAALTLFPQYFFFRPDTPHLSEFMVPFLVAMACSSAIALRAASRRRAWPLTLAAVVFVAACVADEALYFYHSFRKESAGTIAARRKRRSEFAADNGVRVWVKRREAVWMKGIYDAVVTHSTPGDWVITYPYSPTINFMTNRRSYLYNLYVDDASAPPRFADMAIAEIQRHRPAVIVIDNRDINQTEHSRFRNWARPVFDYIQRTHVLVGRFNDDEIEIYVRPDKISPGA